MLFGILFREGVGRQGDASMSGEAERSLHCMWYFYVRSREMLNFLMRLHEKEELSSVQVLENQVNLVLNLV